MERLLGSVIYRTQTKGGGKPSGLELRLTQNQLTANGDSNTIAHYASPLGNLLFHEHPTGWKFPTLSFSLTSGLLNAQFFSVWAGTLHSFLPFQQASCLETRLRCHLSQKAFHDLTGSVIYSRQCISLTQFSSLTCLESTQP